MPKKKPKNEARSISKILRSEGRSNLEFEANLSNLSLEEVIALKLEISSRELNGKLYGFPLWHSLNNIIADAILKFAISATKSQNDAARLLGLNQEQYFQLLKNYRVNHFFEKSS